MLAETVGYISAKQGSEKSFGFVFSIVFLVVALYPLTNSVVV